MPDVGENGDVTGDPNRRGPAALPPAPLGLVTLRPPDGAPGPARSARSGPDRSPTVHPIGRTGTDGSAPSGVPDRLSESVPEGTTPKEWNSGFRNRL
jgi:hypothetical protein